MVAVVYALYHYFSTRGQSARTESDSESEHAFDVQDPSPMAMQLHRFGRSRKLEVGGNPLVELPASSRPVEMDSREVLELDGNGRR